MRLKFLFTVVFLLFLHSVFSQCAGFSNTVITTNVTCLGLSNGSAIVNTVGGTPPYNYQWSNGSNNTVVDSLSEGPYLLVIIDSIGCIDSVQFYIIEPHEIIVDTTISICDVDSFQVGNNYYNQVGSYIDTLVSFNGCDSILNLELNK